MSEGGEGFAPVLDDIRTILEKHNAKTILVTPSRCNKAKHNPRNVLRKSIQLYLADGNYLVVDLELVKKSQGKEQIEGRAGRSGEEQNNGGQWGETEINGMRRKRERERNFVDC